MNNLHRLVSENIEQTVDQHRRNPMVEECGQIVLPSVLFNRSTGIPRDAVQGHLIVRDGLTQLRNSLPWNSNLGGAH